MLRVLPRALRLPCSWRFSGARDCASHATTRTPEIQVQALTGPNQGITEILMNRPNARNALGNVFVSELLEALAQLREDQQVRVLLFRSAVKGVFCAGADLKEREQMSDVEVGTFVQRLRGLMSEIAAFPVPTIAAMDGFALGGGLELALACDLRIAASSAVMGLIETTRGLLPGAGGTQRLPRCLGVALAKELIFTGRRLNGAQARELGLVNHAVAQNEEGNAAYHRALALAQEILPQAPIAVRLGKVAIDRGMENIPTQDRLEGMAAFREKRAPKFVGEEKLQIPSKLIKIKLDREGFLKILAADMKGKKPRTTRQSRRTRHQRRQGAQVILPHRGPQVQVPQKSQSRKMSMWPARSSSVRNCSRQDVRLHAVQAVDKQDIAELCKDKPSLG